MSNTYIMMNDMIGRGNDWVELGIVHHYFTSFNGGNYECDTPVFLAMLSISGSFNESVPCEYSDRMIIFPKVIHKDDKGYFYKDGGRKIHFDKEEEVHIEQRIAYFKDLIASGNAHQYTYVCGSKEEKEFVNEVLNDYLQSIEKSFNLSKMLTFNGRGGQE